MATVTCPNGHESNDPEWCDTCGAKLGAPSTPVAPATPVASGEPAGQAPAVPPPPPAAPAGGVPCPHCGTPTPPDNLFCEQCGYDFTTGQAPPDEPGAAAIEPAGAVDPGTKKWV